MCRIILTLMLTAVLCSSGWAQQESAEDNAGKPDASSTASKQAAEPAIRGQWSEPVNGLRLMAKLLATNETDGEIILIVFAQNCIEKPLSWPGINAESNVVFDGGIAPTQHDQNLRITAKHLDKKIQRHSKAKNRLGGGLARQLLKLQPGEISMQAIRLSDSPHEPQRVLQKNGQVPVKCSTWRGLNHASSKGKWQISLSWRPDGNFPLPKGNLKEGNTVEHARQTIVAGWKNVQIDFPPIEIDWTPQLTEAGPLDLLRQE